MRKKSKIVLSLSPNLVVAPRANGIVENTVLFLTRSTTVFVDGADRLTDRQTVV